MIVDRSLEPDSSSGQSWTGFGGRQHIVEVVLSLYWHVQAADLPRHLMDSSGFQPILAPVTAPRRQPHELHTCTQLHREAVHCSQHLPIVTTPTLLHTTSRILLLGFRSTPSAVLQSSAALSLSLRSARGQVTRPRRPGANDPGSRRRTHPARADPPCTPLRCPRSCPTTTSRPSSALSPRLPTKSTLLPLPNSTSPIL